MQTTLSNWLRALAGNRWLRFTSALTIALTTAVVAGVWVYAAINPLSSAGVIYGCYGQPTSGQTTGTLSIINAGGSCPSGTTALQWEQSGGVHGIKEFTSSASAYTWTAPARIHQVMVEAWGAGGGGGAGYGNTCGNEATGGQGGGGGYAHTVLQVKPGQAYSIAVGLSNAEAAGGDTSFGVAGQAPLLVAHGGQAGSNATSATSGGIGGLGGSISPAGAGIEFAGDQGQNGSAIDVNCNPSTNPGGGDGRGGSPGTMDQSNGGGGGGANGNPPKAGGSGLIILNW